MITAMPPHAGTMLFGESTESYREAYQLLDMCMERGVNFFDSAEMYPVPQRAETHGDSERMLGRWMRERGNRYGGGGGGGGRRHGNTCI